MRLAACAIAALLTQAAVATAEPAPTAGPDGDGEATRTEREIPDLGLIRHRDPMVRRQLWLGFDTGAVFVPDDLTPFRGDAWTVRNMGSWALALTERWAAGGRHGVVLYDARNARIQVQEHLFDLSVRLLPEPLRDRLALSVEFHSLDRLWVDDEDFSIGGVNDRVIGLGYGLTQRLWQVLDLSWNLQLRWVEVFSNSQRQVRATLRPALRLGEGHQLSLEWVMFLVNRDANQFGKDLPRTTLHAQLALEHNWMSEAGVGTFVAARYASGFMSGQAPMYETRPEALNSDYGELHAGVRVVW